MVKSNKKSDNEKIYEYFLNHIDTVSAIRLRGLDMSFQLSQIKYEEKGITLTEMGIYSPKLNIKRSSDGFYADETTSLLSNKNYKIYQNSLAFVKKNEEYLATIHKTLLEKEIIMDGYYIENKTERSILEEISTVLGYNNIREKELKENDGIHPSIEYKRVVSLLNEVNTAGCDNDDIIFEVLSKLESFFKKDVKIKLKYISDEEDSFGVMIESDGIERMVYEVTSLDIIKSDCSPYLESKCDYLEIYFRILSKAIKNKKYEKMAKKA